MRIKETWAYDFRSDRSFEDILAVLDKESPWAWEVRDSAWYGEYLTTVPAPGSRIVIHAYPYDGDAGRFFGLHDEGFSTILRIGVDSGADRAEIDRTFRTLLSKIGAHGITEIEPYD